MTLQYNLKDEGLKNTNRQLPHGNVKKTVKMYLRTFDIGNLLVDCGLSCGSFIICP